MLIKKELTDRCLNTRKLIMKTPNKEKPELGLQVGYSRNRQINNEIIVKFLQEVILKEVKGKMLFVT